MKTKIKLLALAFSLLFLNLNTNLSAQVGIGTTSPDPSSALDINLADKGLLIPRVALSATNDLTSIVNPATSLLVYNTNTLNTGSTSVTEGFYYFNGTLWTPISNTSSSKDWGINGNAETNPATDYIGTSDDEDLVVATNATPRLRVDNDSFQLKAMGDGTQNQPFYSWNLDTDTGIWRKGDDQLALGAGNTEFISLAQNTTDLLTINGTNNNNFDVHIKGSTLDELFFLDGSANTIGMGTVNPTSRLDVFSDSGFAINTSGRIKGIFSRSQTANIGSSGGSFILDNDAITTNGHQAEGVMAGVIQDGSIVGAYGFVTNSANNWGVYTPDNLVALQLFQFSDQRLKRDIQPFESALDKVLKLNPVSYYWDNKTYTSFGTENRKQLGFLAQELEETFPELINKASIGLPAYDDKGRGEKFDAVNYDGLIPVLTKAIQEQQQLIAQLTKRLDALD
ncbi:MAG: tail fiber domain-containing protein [Bacteroidota bacterium]